MKVFTEVLEERIKDLDDAAGHFYVQDGAPRACARCGHAIPLPGVMIPTRIEPKSGSPVSPSGYPYENQVAYSQYHRACAILELLIKPDLSKFIQTQPKKDEKQR